MAIIIQLFRFMRQPYVRKMNVVILTHEIQMELYLYHPKWNPIQTMLALDHESVSSCWYLVRMYHFRYERIIINVTVAKLSSVCF